MHCCLAAGVSYLNLVFRVVSIQEPATLCHYPCQVKESLLLEMRLSAPSSLDNNGPCHNVIHSPVMLEEEESNEDRKEEGNGEVLIQRTHRRAVKSKTKETRQNKSLNIKSI